MEKVFIGIDISSSTLDVCICTGSSSDSVVIGNNTKAIKRFLKQHNHEECHIAMENTGRYNWFLYEALEGYKGHAYVVSPLHLKKSLGLARGKSDKVDAIRIASFVEKHHGDLPEWRPTSKVLHKLKVLLPERELRIKQRKQLLQVRKGLELDKASGLSAQLLRMNKKAVAEITRQLDELEGMIEQTLQEDGQLQAQAALLKSIPGVGKVLCWALLSATEGFTKITDPRKMACYCGVAPFEHRSGTSVRGRSRVSVFADKRLKSLLQIAALAAIRSDAEIRAYFQRKIAEGKHKMAVFNAVRNKILHRIYAVIKNQKPYEKRLVLS